MLRGLAARSVGVVLQRRLHLAMAPKRKAAAAAAAAGDGVLKAEVPAAEATEGEGGAAVPAPKKRAPAKKKAAAPPPELPVYSQSLRPPPLAEGGFKILSWNVAGLRAVLKKDPAAIKSLAEKENADVICLQEIKLQDKDCSDVAEKLGLEGWNVSWNCSAEKKGYSGVAILSKRPPLAVSAGINHDHHDGEGRVLVAEFDTFYLVNVYVPNAGEGLKRLEYRVKQWDTEFAAYLKQLGSKKPVVLTGDLNVAHNQNSVSTVIDIANPKPNVKNAGFTPEERASFEEQLLGEAGLVDCFRRQHPDCIAYTYWSHRFNARANNKGWRLDYFLASQSLLPSVHDCWHMPDVTGSDHCPIGLCLKHQ